MRIVIDLQACQTQGSKNRGIGRYSMALAQAMARNAGQHEFFLALNGCYLDTIEPIRAAFDDLIPQERIRVFEVAAPIADITVANTWRRQVSERMREAFIADLQPDFVHISSLFEGLVEDAVTSIGHLDQNAPNAVTLYDLIPLLNPKPYLENATVRDWYYRKLQFAKRGDLLLAISESSRQEGIAALQLPPERVVNISCAIDPSFRPIKLQDETKVALRRRYGLKGRFVMYTGGIDHRKNIEGLIVAYAMLPGKLRRDHQLAIVCSIQQADRDLLSALCAKEGLASDEVVLTGYVSECDLLHLYNVCTLFVFPSLHEGFGLPALEAMACGAATIGSNNSSIPEVIGLNAALFDARTPRSIAEKIASMLQNEASLARLRDHGLKQAAKFSWAKSARSALEAIEAVKERQDRATTVAVLQTTRLRLAYVSPMPPEQTGIADYSAELVPELTRYYDIDVIVDQP
jgi:glycosyltransferase involved in cell wall biosynthesis